MADDLNRLGALIRQLQGALGGNSVKIGVATATFAGATDAASISVTHGLGRTPVVVLVTCGLRSDGSARTYASQSSVGSTTFTAFAIVTGTNPSAGVTVPINWVVIG